MAAKTCAHSTCTCSVNLDELYCSSACREANEGTGSAADCRCGHSGCLGNAGRAGPNALGRGFESPVR